MTEAKGYGGVMDITNGRGGEIFRWIKTFGRQIVSD